MKRSKIFVFAMVCSLSFVPVFAHNTIPEESSEIVLDENRNTLSEKEVQQIADRVEEIRLMRDKDIGAEKISELKNELIRYRDILLMSEDPFIYISGSTLLIIIILLIIFF
ncbi:MAG TPA: hypothetical protein VKA10_02285 [Prolixibacteraceae bacterium]|nr:hypothetical protein [Prolixibacteraceae bacterium]